MSEEVYIHDPGPNRRLILRVITLVTGCGFRDADRDRQNPYSPLRLLPGIEPGRVHTLLRALGAETSYFPRERERCFLS
jgi:hypothetical protein